MSFVADILARAEETIPVVRSRARSRFEEQAPTVADASDFIVPSEDATTVRPPSRERLEAAIDSPGGARSQPSAAERQPRETDFRRSVPATPSPGDVQSPSRQTIIDRVERIVETHRPPGTADSPPPGERHTSSHTDPPRTPDIEGAPIRTPPTDRPVPAVPVSTEPATVEKRIETVLRTIRTEVERERIVERIVSEPPAAGQLTESPVAAVTRPTAEWTEPRPVLDRVDAGTRDSGRTAAIGSTVPSLPPARPAARETLPPPGQERVLHVSIGQLEIRATRRGLLDRKRGTDGQRAPAAPRLTLEEYLRERNGGAS